MNSMKKPNLCLVTALFDIGRGEMGTSFSRGFDHYKECFSRLLKLKKFPMVIFCEAELEDFIWQYRDRNNTKIVIKTLDDIRKFPFYDEVQNIRTSKEWLGQSGWLAESTQARLELYNPLVFSKQFFLNDASLFNPFDTKYFLWIDAGITNTVSIEQYLDDSFEERITPLLNKMLFVAFPYDGTIEVHGFSKGTMNELAGRDTRYVCRGGIFGGNADSIHDFNEMYYSMLNDTLKMGKMGTEESVFTILSYKHHQKFNIRMIESDGLVYKFFEDLKKAEIYAETKFPLAFYVLTYNTPKQFNLFVERFKKAYPDDFNKHKKYVIDNSTDEVAKKEYRKLFKENNFEIIHEGNNIGINDGRFLAAKHFDTSEHKYYVFFEEDFVFVSKDDPKQNTDGFVRYLPNIFNNSIDILEENDFDFLRLTIIEFFGKCINDWSFKNLPLDKRNEYFPPRDDGNEDLRWKTKIAYLGIYKDISYASGEFHYSNWPILFSRRGNRQVFLDIVYDHLYEQTIMSQAKMFMVEGKLKVGCLMAAPIYHDRRWFYDGKTRRENRHYTN